MANSNLAQLGYEHYHAMLSDKIRMDAYKKAIDQCVKPGDIVIDLGAGTGILSIWAIKAGAKKVYAIEKTESIELAKEIARSNNCLDKIEFINDNSMQVELPEKADVLISETLGSFAIDENTLEFTNDIRKRLLKENAILIPQAIELYIAPVDDPAVYNKIDFWRKIPGIDFSPAFDLFSKKIMVENLSKSRFLAAEQKIASLDLTQPMDSLFKHRLYMQIQQSGQLHGIAGWFRTQLCAGIDINTSPSEPITHWKQAFFPFQDPIKVIAGDVLDWSVSIGAKEKHSDDTLISYEYRCTQLINEASHLRKSPAKKTGRNTPCPCGSGKKFKHCCS